MCPVQQGGGLRGSWNRSKIQRDHRGETNTRTHFGGRQRPRGFDQLPRHGGFTKTPMSSSKDGGARRHRWHDFGATCPTCWCLPIIASGPALPATVPIRTCGSVRDCTCCYFFTVFYTTQMHMGVCSPCRSSRESCTMLTLHMRPIVVLGMRCGTEVYGCIFVIQHAIIVFNLQQPPAVFQYAIGYTATIIRCAMVVRAHAAVPAFSLSDSKSFVICSCVAGAVFTSWDTIFSTASSQGVFLTVPHELLVVSGNVVLSCLVGSIISGALAMLTWFVIWCAHSLMSRGNVDSNTGDRSALSKDPQNKYRSHRLFVIVRVVRTWCIVVLLAVMAVRAHLFTSGFRERELRRVGQLCPKVCSYYDPIAKDGTYQLQIKRGAIKKSSIYNDRAYCIVLRSTDSRDPFVAQIQAVVRVPGGPDTAFLEAEITKVCFLTLSDFRAICQNGLSNADEQLLLGSANESAAVVTNTLARYRPLRNVTLLPRMVETVSLPSLSSP